MSTEGVVWSELTAIGSFWAISISKEYMIHSISFLITPVKTGGVHSRCLEMWWNIGLNGEIELYLMTFKAFGNEMEHWTKWRNKIVLVTRIHYPNKCCCSNNFLLGFPFNYQWVWKCTNFSNSLFVHYLRLIFIFFSFFEIFIAVITNQINLQFLAFNRAQYNNNYQNRPFHGYTSETVIIEEAYFYHFFFFYILNKF